MINYQTFGTVNNMGYKNFIIAHLTKSYVVRNRTLMTGQHVLVIVLINLKLSI